MSVCGTVDSALHHGFSWLHRLSRIAFGSPRQLSSPLRAFATYQLRRGISNATPDLPPSVTWLLGSTLLHTNRYRNINLLSIAYGYYALGLGPTNPTRIHLPSETLGFRRTRFSRVFSLLIPAFALLIAPASLTPSPSSPQNAPLPLHSQPSRCLQRAQYSSHGFGDGLEPRWIVGAGSLDQ